MSFVLPDDYKLDNKIQANVKIWMPDLPAYEWQFNDKPIILPRPAWQWYVALLVLLLALASVAFYLSRYRHALVLALCDQQTLFSLPMDQLAEVKLRLRKVNRLDDVLGATSVSRATLDKGIDFFQAFSPQQKAEHFALRVAAECVFVIEQQGLAVFELKLAESFPLNLPSFWLVLLEPDLAAQDALQNLKTLPQYLTRTLVKALQRRYQDQGACHCVYVSLGNEFLMPYLADELGLTLGADTPQNDLDAFVAALGDYLHQLKQHLIILADEADKFIRHERQQDYALLNLLRRLSEQGQYSFMLAGYWDLYEHAVLGYQSPLKNFGEILRIDALEKDACRQLATEPMRAMRITYANDALVDKLIEATGQRANLLSVASAAMAARLVTYFAKVGG